MPSIWSAYIEKSLETKAFFLSTFFFHFLGFQEQPHTLGGSLLPYRFVVNFLDFFN